MQLTITAWGHPNIRSTHQTTWQLTTDSHLTVRGDCIIGTRASHSSADLPPAWRSYLQQGGRVSIKLQVGDHQLLGQGTGHADLGLRDHQDMVFRRSQYTCDRTVLVNCSLTASDLPQAMVRQLQDSQQQLIIELNTDPIEQ